MSDVEDKIQKGVDKINEYTDNLNRTVDSINEAASMISNGRKFLSYWSPGNSENRKADRIEAQLWFDKCKKMERRFYILWICIIIVTIIICVKVL